MRALLERLQGRDGFLLGVREHGGGHHADLSVVCPALLGQIRRCRSQKNGHLDVVRHCLELVGKPVRYLPEFAQRVIIGTAVNSLWAWIQFQMKTSDYREHPGAGPAYRPKQLLVLLQAGGNQASIRGYHLDCRHAQRTESPMMRVPGNSSA